MSSCPILIWLQLIIWDIGCLEVGLPTSYQYKLRSYSLTFIFSSSKYGLFVFSYLLLIAAWVFVLLISSGFSMLLLRVIYNNIYVSFIRSLGGLWPPSWFLFLGVLWAKTCRLHFWFNTNIIIELNTLTPNIFLSCNIKFEHFLCEYFPFSLLCLFICLLLKKKLHNSSIQ